MIESIKDELKGMMGSRLFWFFAGVMLSGHDVPSVVNSLRTFVGL